MKTLSDFTQRELEILYLVLAGHANKAIAAEIFICEKTVLGKVQKGTVVKEKSEPLENGLE